MKKKCPNFKNKNSRLILILSLTAGLLSSCHRSNPSDEAEPLLVGTQDRFEKSNIAGNLMATAIKEIYEVDIVFYPSALLTAHDFAIIDGELNEQVIDERILPLYPSDTVRDLFQIGTLSGKQIKKFVLDRSNENYQLDLQTAGVEYDVQYIGGMPSIYSISRPHNLPLEDDKNYRVAINDFYYFNALTFPGYRLRNSMENNLERQEGLYSARDALKTFLLGFKRLPLLDEPRAQVSSHLRGTITETLTIPQIQGRAHLSPFYGFNVTTRGVITAAATLESGGTDIYVQSTEDDGDPLTSNAINVYLRNNHSELGPGQLVEITGTVFEVTTNQGLTRTSIRDVSSIEVLEAKVALPEPIVLGTGGVAMPNQVISSYEGNLNQKPGLNLNDGIDFWESLEGMRVRIIKPTVVGFRGGDEKLDSRESSYITVFVRPEGASSPENISASNGLIEDGLKGNLNPEVIRISDSELAPYVNADRTFNVGDKFNYNLDGIVSFQTNTFGDGEFVVFVTGDFGSLSSPKTLENKPKTKLVADDEHLTVISFNVENLAGNRTVRINEIARVISISLKCPDIMVLPEIQDNNGEAFEEGPYAQKTLDELIAKINCPGAEYVSINIDPVSMQDGGVPGGNIRVSMMYNAKRVGFESIGNAQALDETYVLANGALNQNPGRLSPNDEAFRSSRKPLIAEFGFKGQRVLVIGNHLNSKLGDSSRWSAIQPFISNSDQRRSQLTSRINEFVTRYIKLNPTSSVIVTGDMNAFYYEDSMKVLEGHSLFNLMTSTNYPKNQWYSSNYDGSAGAIDHMLVNQVLMDREPEFEILHVNSDFMGKSSDHDPVIGRFKF